MGSNEGCTWMSLGGVGNVELIVGFFGLTVSMIICARVTRSMRWVETESRELPTYERFIYTLDKTPNTYDKFEQLRQGTQ